VHAAIANSTDPRYKAAVLVGKKLIGNDSCVSRSAIKPADIPEKSPLFPPETSTYDAAKEKKARRDQYAIEQEQREREEGWRDNPSVDVDTQRAIILEYRALHEQFKSEGLYQCNYSAYAWESLRYLALFAAFGYFLHIKWYYTSAIFLGLFWVCASNHCAVS
jgi:delta8-fatty-acid desaturase